MSFIAGEFTVQSENVFNDAEDLSKKNTAKQYDPKILEFKAYCKAVYFERQPESYETVNEDKLFGFLYYQSRRAPRKRGKKRKRVDDVDSNKVVFNINEYYKIMSGTLDQTATVGYSSL